RLALRRSARGKCRASPPTPPSHRGFSARATRLAAPSHPWTSRRPTMTDNTAPERVTLIVTRDGRVSSVLGHGTIGNPRMDADAVEYVRADILRELREAVERIASGDYGEDDEGARCCPDCSWYSGPYTIPCERHTRP